MGLASLPGEWEVAERAIANLTALERLGTDERIQIRHLIQALRWNPLAEIFGCPLRALFGLIPRKGKNETKKVGTAA